MQRFVDLPSLEQQRIFNSVKGLKADGLGYKRIIKRIRQEENVNLCLSTLSYWFNNEMQLLGGENWFEEKPSRELSYLIGVMFGDGSLSFNEKKQDYGIKLESVDRDFVEKFSECLAKVLKKKRKYAVSKISRGPIYSTHARSKQLYNFFKSLKEDFSKAKPFIEEYPAEFIQGLADSEGCPKIGAGRRFSCGVNVAVSTNQELLEYARVLLRQNFSISAQFRLCKKAGVIDSVIDGRKIKRTKNLYGLEISANEDTQIFHDKIGFSIMRKQNKLSDALKIVKNFAGQDRPLEWKNIYHKEGRRWVRN